VEAIRDGFWGFTRAHPGAGTEGSICMLECTPNARARRVPPSATAFNNRGNYYNVGIVWTWDDPGLDGEVREYNRSFQRKVRALGYHDDEDRKDGVGRYINYLSSDAVAAEVAFGSNADRLREIKAKYDPTNVFDKLWKLLGKIEER
jgi:FAD/FMN-containing dehydrogenase